MKIQGKGYLPVPAHQADAALSQANPVSGTKYTVLATTKLVRLISIMANITWAVTQPTPIEVHITIDGVPHTFTLADPVSVTNYFPYIDPRYTALLQKMSDTIYTSSRAFLLEGRSVKVEAEITWETTQPTPLVCRVKYAKW